MENLNIKTTNVEGFESVELRDSNTDEYIFAQCRDYDSKVRLEVGYATNRCLWVSFPVTQELVDFFEQTTELLKGKLKDEN
jgi:hypothetical protein